MSGPVNDKDDAVSRGEALIRAFHEEAQITRSYDMGLILRLWPFVRPHARHLVLSITLLMATAAAALVRPLLMRSVVDAGAVLRDPDAVARSGWWLAVVIVVEQLLSFMQLYTMQIAGARAMVDLRAHVFGFLHGLRLAFFDRQPIGRLVTRVTNDVDAINELFASGALNAAGDLVRLVGIVAIMLVLDWRLSLIAFAALPPVAIFVNSMRRRARTAFREIRVKLARLNAFLNEQVQGMSIVQAFCRERAAAAEHDVTNREYRDANFRSIRYDAMLDAAIEMVSAICVALLLASIGVRRSSIGTLVAFIAYIRQFFEPIANLAQRYTILQSAMAGAERVFELLDTAEPDDGETARKMSEPEDEVAFELEHVTFGYRPGAPVLFDVSVRAKKGEKIALVGPTGSGKTTVASLILRLYEADGGVRVLGRDVRQYGRKDLRRRFGVVPQDVYLFPGTIATNVAMGDRHPDRDRVERALAAADALDLFRRREGGIDARVDERGSNFSLGERQLIAFARAVYRDAPMLILDEATASVDSDTESRLQRATEALMRGRTALIIAHRLSTIRAADKIVVMNRGRIAEEGTHDELMARGGLYARLYALMSSKSAA
jgi:ATP-binding cassette, subfamily B, multidrug efflux pump